jgi:hypothetical protein
VRRASSFAPFLVSAAFLSVAAVTFVWLRSAPESRSEPELAQPDPRIRRLLRELQPAPPLERAPGPPVRSPELPDVAAGKEELWRYGERYLGWETLDDVDLDEYSPEDLHTWLEQDRELYAQALQADEAE